MRANSCGWGVGITYRLVIQEIKTGHTNQLPVQSYYYIAKSTFTNSTEITQEYKCHSSMCCRGMMLIYIKMKNCRISYIFLQDTSHP